MWLHSDACLIDCHVHIVAVVASLGLNAALPDSLVMARSIKLQREMLEAGLHHRARCRECRLRTGGGITRRLWGVASPTDAIHFLDFSREEITAVVEEASSAATYVSAHLYADVATRHAVDCGVHLLDHCNLIEAPTARLAASKGAFAVPALITCDKRFDEGEALGIGLEAIAKIDNVRLAGMHSLEIMQQAGLPMAYGTDLLGPMHRQQSEKFVIRSRVLPAQTVIASATGIAAKLCRLEGQIGSIAPAAFTDLIMVNGDPPRDPSLLTG